MLLAGFCTCRDQPGHIEDMSKFAREWGVPQLGTAEAVGALEARTRSERIRAVWQRMEARFADAGGGRSAGQRIRIVCGDGQHLGERVAPQFEAVARADGSRQQISSLGGQGSDSAQPPRLAYTRDTERPEVALDQVRRVRNLVSWLRPAWAVSATRHCF